uniref:PIN domain-containing protein n=1 Tax=Lactuca sativa TaxID=4236 RepID=A0A9R1WC59_LACSA|nr:hypothetical protein LSAT_V11C200073820 [Lactuca sativa]
MGRAKKGPKFAVMKKLVSHKAIKQHKEDVLNPNKKDLTKLPRNVPYVSSALFFTYNTALGPPYRVLVDTNFINFSIQNKHKCYLVATCDRDLKRRIRKLQECDILGVHALH